MKNNLYNCLFILLFILVIIAISLAIADINLNSLKFSFDHLYNVVCIFISVLGLLVTSYFVILAVNAYSHVKEIENILQKAKDIENKVQSADEAVKSTLNKVEKLVNESSMLLYYDIEMQFDSTKTKTEEKYRALKLRQARLAYKFPEFLDEQIKTSALLLLGDLGDESDIEPLEQYLKTTKDSSELRDIAKLVISCLKKD